ncbi:MAG: PucR family transcriptional regulator ligand-binding domain-containing protein [Antricoccus sp.]
MPSQVGLSMREVMQVRSLQGAQVIAGWAGLGRVVERMNIMEVPDVLPWVKTGELLLTTGYPIKDDPSSLTHLVQSLDRRGLAGLAIKLGRYLEELPEEMLRAANERDFPIVLIDNQCGFDDVMNDVLTAILHKQAVAIERSEAIHQALIATVLAGGGLPEVCRDAASLLNAPVLIEDILGRVLTVATPTGPCEQTDIDGLSDRRNSPHDAVQIVAAEARLGTIRALPDDDERQQPLYSDATTVLERAATVAALAITRQQAVNEVETRYQSDLVRDLVEGRGLELSRVLAQAAGFGWDLDRPLITCVIEYAEDVLAAPSPAQIDRLANAWQRALRTVDTNAACVGFSGHAVALIGTTITAEALQIVAKQVARALAVGDRPSRVGVGRGCRNTNEIPSSYSQAKRSLTVGRRFSGDGAVTMFDDLGVYRLLSLIPDSAELQSYVGEVLGQLAEHDPESDDLRETLLVLLETNLNIARAARILHFHYNTLRYRIGKLERLVGPFTDDATLRLNLLLALHVMKARTC